MKVDVLTLFPDMFSGPLDESILKRARDKGLLDLKIHCLRDYARDKHRTVDERPFGGGPGMVMRPEPVFEAVESLRSPQSRVVMMAPSGKAFKQAEATRLALCSHLILLCGSYEGFDERIREALVDDVFSIGDYVLTNGALAAMVLVDCVSRLLPGVLGDEGSAQDESFSDGLLEYPHYTRPAEFRGMQVPEILLSGHHAAIAKWRHEQSLVRTRENRPDLMSLWENKNNLD
jgi:tRNA (guanine37-N1)-methyltransferase